MSDTVNTAEIRVTADASGVEVGLRQATDAANRADRAISGIGGNAARSQQNLIAAIQRTTAQMEAGSRTSARYWEITARQRGVDPAVLEPYLRQLRRVEEAQRQAANSAESVGATIKGALGSALAGLSIAAIGQQIIGAQREFDKLNASLVTATGSTQKAAQAFSALQAFAATTPFGLAESTEAFVKMRNLGLDPSERALRSYGNTAAAMGKSLEQMVEAVADASTGEFERLKEFGIKASQNGEKLTLTFKGASTTIKNDAAAIESYLMKLGEVDFAGAMVQRAATLDGAISQLSDTWESTMRAISNGGIGQAAQDGVLGLSAALGDLQTILNAISEAAEKQGQKLNLVSGIHTALTTVFEAVSVLGLNVAYVFKQVGNEIGGLAAQAKAVATGDFAGARFIGQQMRADAERDRKEVDRQTAAILGAVEKAKKAAEGVPKSGATDALAEFRTKREAERESEEAAKRRAQQAKREAETLAELAGLTKTFAAEWQMLSKLYADGKINLEGLTKAQADLLAKQPAMKAAVEQETKARKESDEFNKRYLAGLSAITDIYDEQIKDAKKEAEANEERARSYGLSAAAIAKEEVARLNNQLARAHEQGLSLTEIEHLKEMIKLRERSAAALASTEAKDASAKAAEKAAEDWRRAAESIEQSLTDALLRGFESGKSFGKNLVDTLKNMFQTLILRPTIQGIMAPVAGSLMGSLGMAGTAQASAGSAAGSAAGSIASGLGLGGIAATIGTGAMQTAGALLTGQIGLGSTLSAGLSAIGAGTASSITAGLSSVVGALGPIAMGIGAVAMVLKKGFGYGPKEVTRTSIDGTFGAGGFVGNINETWKKEGGWFVSDKGGSDRKGVEAEMVAALNQTYDALKASTAGYIETLGINSDWLMSRSQNLSVALTGDAAKDQQAIAEFFTKISDDIAREFVPALTGFQKAGESASATLQRLATDYAMIDTALTSIGMQFGAVGVASLEARERLVEAAGGLEAFAANTAGFQQNFLTDAERNAPVLKAVTEQLAALGLAGVDTRDEFKSVVLGLDLTTEAGSKQYGSLMKLQAAFAQVYPAIEDTSAALSQMNKGLQDQIDEILRARMSPQNLRAFDTKDMDASTVALYDRLAALKLETAALEKAAGESKSLQDQWESLTMTRSQLAEKERNALEPSNRARWDEIQAIRTANEWLDRASQSSARAIEQQDAMLDFGQAIVGSLNRAKDAAKALREFNDSLVLGNLSALDPDARYREAKRQFEAANPNDTQAAQAFLQASKDRGVDSFYYERDFAAVQAKIGQAIASADQAATVLPGFFAAAIESMRAPTFIAPTMPPVVATMQGGMSRSSAQQSDVSRVEAKVDQLIEKLGGTMEVVASSTAKTADLLDRVTEGGNGMVNA